jgi:hypothetical protein
VRQNRNRHLGCRISGNKSTMLGVRWCKVKEGMREGAGRTWGCESVEILKDF